MQTMLSAILTKPMFAVVMFASSVVEEISLPGYVMFAFLTDTSNS